MTNYKNYSLGLLVFYILLWVYGIGSWIINLVKLFQCDFEASYKEEIIHLIGVIIAPSSMITVWF